MTLFAGALAAVGAAAVAGEALEQQWMSPAFGLFLLGVIASPWLANYLAGVTVRR